MDLIYKLEDQLKYQWDKAHKARSQSVYLELKKQALETYRLLKKQKQLIGMN